MKIGKVIGNVVATRKDERLVGYKLLVVKILYPTKDGELKERESYYEDSYCVAVDLVDAGVGELVLLCSGSSARVSAAREVPVPVDEAIVGIIDNVDIYVVDREEGRCA
ncbi:MAG: EutN/CcmL family microcompartment protein [Synergistetes bacterium]|nr:MAG: Ethanolamine utilization protein EutN/carboxysome structural protein Ccml [bacterium 42_11]MBC7332737.1 EutN/CcmL family microcompartment protein [Synergistota bacterium]MDK2870666.1 ethanolamine utilization protein EutN [bacterium]